MKSPAAGFQIAFLVLAAVFLNAPLEKYVVGQWQWARDLELDLGRTIIIASGGLILCAVAPLRRACAAFLSTPVPRGSRWEIPLAVFVNYIAALGALGAIALWVWLVGAEPALARRMGSEPTAAAQWSDALSATGIVTFVFTAGLLAPIVEELVFRGFLYRAWIPPWGWVGAALASSLVFGLFHGLVVPQFLVGLVFVTVMRRTVSIRASVYAHALFNLSAWYPLLGQFMTPTGHSTGELHLWTFHIVCLAAALILVPLYMWSARDARVADRS
jgi:membrane protease YdiL (CAAX protease family)